MTRQNLTNVTVLEALLRTVPEKESKYRKMVSIYTFALQDLSFFKCLFMQTRWINIINA